MKKRLTLTGHWARTSMDPITVTFEGCYAYASDGQIRVYPNGGEPERYFIARYTRDTRSDKANLKAFRKWRSR